MSEAEPAGRVVLGRKAPGTFAGFQWTGREPEGLYEVEVAEELGAAWEGDELVTYDLETLRYAVGRAEDGWLPDSD